MCFGSLGLNNTPLYHTERPLLSTLVHGSLGIGRSEDEIHHSIHGDALPATSRDVYPRDPTNRIRSFREFDQDVIFLLHSAADDLRLTNELK